DLPDTDSATIRAPERRLTIRPAGRPGLRCVSAVDAPGAATRGRVRCFVPAYTAAVARAERASERMRSTMERKPLEPCGGRCSRKPNRANSATASVGRMSLAALPE